MVNVLDKCMIMVYNVFRRSNLTKGKTENSVKAGRLCHPVPVLIVRGGGGCYGKIHIKNYIFNYYVFDNTYKKSKIAPPDQVRAIF